MRVAAAKIQDGDQWHLSVAAVNNSDEARTLRLLIPAAAGQPTTLSLFEYFDTEGNNRVDAWPEVIDDQGNDIYPTPTRTLDNVDLGEGLELALPSKSVLVITTLKQRRALKLT